MSNVEETLEDVTVHSNQDNISDREENPEGVRDPNRDQDPNASRSPNRDEGGRKRTHSEGDDDGSDPTPKRVKSDDPFATKKIIKEEDEGKWTLPESLADHFISHTKTHIADKDMRKNMIPYALPTNIDCIPTMDNTFKSLLRKEKAGPAIEVDGDWEVVQRKVQDVMGPLGKVWENCKRYERGELDTLDITEACDRLDMAVLCLGHAVQKISWFRRIHSLSALGALKSVKDTLKEEKARKIFEEDTSNNLIPKEFDELLKADKGSRTNLLTHFKPPAEKKKAGTSASSSKTNNDGKERRFLKRTPFPSRPSGSGGGGFDDRRNDRYNNNNYKGYKNQPGKGYQGKHAENRNSSQHAFISRLVVQPKLCSSSSNSSIPSKGGDSSAGGKNCQVLSQLEAHNKRQSNTEHCEGVGDSVTRNTKPIKDSPLYKDEQGGGTGNGSGDRKHAGQGSHQGGNTQRDSVLEQCIRHPQRGGPISPNYKLEGVKQLCPIPSLQNGGVEGRKIPSEEGRLDVQNRPEGCLLLSSLEHTIPKAGPLQLEREAVRVSLPSLRLRSSPKDFYKINESPCGTLETARDSSSYLPRRHVDHGLIPRGGDQSKGYHHVSLSSPGIDNQYQKIGPHTLSATGVPGSDCKQSDHVFLPLREEGPKIDFEVSRCVQQPSDDAKKSLLTNRKALVNSCSSHSSSSPIEISSTNVHLSPGSKNALRGNGISLLRRDTGAKMVDGEPRSPKRTANASSAPRDAAKTGGWGAVCHLGSTGGQWSEWEKQQSINMQELLAAELAIKTFTKDHKPASVHMRIDNTSALSYIVKMGGTQSLPMLTVAKRIWQYLLEHEITITAEWIPSHLNTIADWESRNVSDSTEWKLSPRVFQSICRVMGQPDIDLFASRISHQIPKYFSWKPDPDCLAVDAFRQKWGRGLPYAFPPFCLITRVLRQMEDQLVERMILITPLWPTQPWFPLLMSMAIQVPLLLPVFPELLSNPSGLVHPLLQDSSLRLVAWLVSGIDSWTPDFRRNLRASSSILAGKEHPRLTSQPGKGGVCGVVEGVWIPLHAL